MSTGVVSGLVSIFTVEGTALGAARNYTLTLNQATIDATTDDDSRWADNIVGRRDWSIDIDALYVDTDAAQIYLEEHLTAAKPAVVTIVFTTPSSRTYGGTGIVTSITLTSAYEDAVTYSVSIVGDGAIVTSTS